MKITQMNTRKLESKYLYLYKGDNKTGKVPLE